MNRESIVNCMVYQLGNIRRAYGITRIPTSHEQIIELYATAIWNDLVSRKKNGEEFFNKSFEENSKNVQ